MARPRQPGRRAYYRRINGVKKADHRHIVERILGHKLRRTAIVHHVDGDASNNAPNNLVVCDSQAYHMLLHKRQRALEHCGNANWEPCAFCHEYDAPENMVPRRCRWLHYAHRKCQNAYARELRRLRYVRA